MIRKLALYSLCSTTVVLLTSSQVMAAGFQVNAQSATGLGRAFAGDAVIADNAAVMARNPAAMTLFDSIELSTGVVVMNTLIEVKDAKYNGVDIPDRDDLGDLTLVPNFHLIVPVSDSFAFGVNAYTNFGTKTEFPSDYIASEFGGKTSVASYNLGLAGAYRINSQWSVGAGVDFIYAQGTMQRTSSATLPPDYGGVTLMDVDEADGWATGFNLGAVYEWDENNRFGLSYRYSPSFTAKDDKDQKINLNLPDIVEFSGYHRIPKSKFAVHYSVQWIGWGVFDTIEFENLNGGMVVGDMSKPYQWQDGWHYSIGTTYYLNDQWTLRAGYMYDTSAQDKVTSISVPDSDRQWFSAGFSYTFSEKSSMDFGLTYLMGNDVKVVETSDLGTTIHATSRADAVLSGLQYNYSF